MIATSQDFIEASGLESRQVKTSCIFNSETTLTGDGEDGAIISISYNEVMESQEGMSMGGTGMSDVSVTILMPSDPLSLKNGTMQPSIGLVLADGTDEFVDLGFFYNADIRTTDDYKTATITAYDAMSKTEVPYEPTVAFPASADAVLDDIAALCGFSVGSIPWGDAIPTLDTFLEGTCRQYIGWIAGLLGCNAKFGRDGNLTMLYYNDGSIDSIVSRSVQYLGGLTILADNPITIKSVTSGINDHVITAGTGFGIEFSNPFITQEIVDGILTNIDNFSYQPLSCKWRGNPAIETGDIVFVTLKDGTNALAPVMQHTLVVTGGMYDTINAYGKTELSYALDARPSDKKVQAVYQNLMAAIAEASKLIDGASGGIFRVTDSNNDGVNDGWLLSDSPDLNAARKLIKANYAGIGLSNDGGLSYRTALTADGINADEIAFGHMSGERIQINGNTLSDYIYIGNKDPDDPTSELVIRIGSADSPIYQQQENDRIVYYDSDGNELAFWSNNSFEIKTLNRFRLGNIAIQTQQNGSWSFVLAED